MMLFCASKGMLRDANSVLPNECNKACNALDVQVNKIHVAYPSANVMHMFQMFALGEGDAMYLCKGFASEQQQERRSRTRRGKRGEQQLEEANFGVDGALVTKQAQSKL